jgi:ABC-type antimicrobial peptide transport system permease subunit
MQRQREMGIRTALGASVGHTIGLVVRDGMSMTMLGVVLGSPAQLAHNKSLLQLWSGLNGSTRK